VSHKILHNFYISSFRVFRQKLENVAKVLGQGVDINGFDHFDYGFDHGKGC
jgi:hypothetical protein